MKILVAGSKSFIGKNIHRYYELNTDIKVIGVSRSDCDFKDANALVQLCKDNKPDVIIHTAVSLVSTHDNLAMYLSLEKLAHLVSKIIMIGSGAEYGHQRYIPNMKESYYDIEQPPLNNDAYHLSKYLISRIHQDRGPTNIFNFRGFGLFGMHEDYTRRLISSNIYSYLKHGYMKANANHSFDYLYIDDFIKAIEIFCDSPRKPEYRTYNVCSGKALMFSDILSEVILALGGRIDEIEFLSSSYSGYEYSGDPSLFETEFGHRIMRTTLHDATMKMKDWVAEVIRSED